MAGDSPGAATLYYHPGGKQVKTDVLLLAHHVVDITALLYHSFHVLYSS